MIEYPSLSSSAHASDSPSFPSCCRALDMRLTGQTAYLREVRARADHHPLPRFALFRDGLPAATSAEWRQRYALPPSSRDTGNRISFARLRAFAETRDSEGGRDRADSRVQSVPLDAVSTTLDPCPSSRPQPAIPRDARSAHHRRADRSSSAGARTAGGREEGRRVTRTTDSRKKRDAHRYTRCAPGDAFANRARTSGPVATGDGRIHPIRPGVTDADPIGGRQSRHDGSAIPDDDGPLPAMRPPIGQSWRSPRS